MTAALLALLMELPLGAIAGWTLAAALALRLLRQSRETTRNRLLLARDRGALAAAYGDLAASRESGVRLRHQLEAVLAATIDGVQILDAESRLAMWNDRFPESTGVPRELLRVGMSLEDMLRGQAQAGEFGAVDVETEVRRRLKLMRGNRELGVIERVRPNGQVTELRRSPLPGGGIVTLYTDVTARRRGETDRRDAERLRVEVPVQRARFVGMVGDAMRAEIDALRAVLETQGGATAARRHAQRMQHLLDDALELSMLDAGKVTLVSAPFELRPLLAQIVANETPAAARRGMRLDLQVSPDVPGWLAGDGARVGRIVRAMLDDAIGFADPGPVTLRVSRLGLGSQPILQVAVRDPGPPAASLTADRLFLPFARRNAAGPRGQPAEPGTGLELSIAARLVEMMNGQIGQGAAPDRGRELWTSLPLPIAEPGVRPRGELARPLPELPPARKLRRAFVLLVEDIVVNQVVTATQLRRDGHRVDVAEDGATAIRMAASAPYDVVFMDLMMPGMSGFEAARHVRSLTGPAGRIPIIALTANTSPEDRTKCLDSGMQEMLSKPVRPKELAIALARALKRDDTPADVPALTPPEEDGDRALLGLDRLAELREGLSGELFVSLAEQCLTEMDEMLRVLHAALESERPSQIDAAAHALAGMAGGYGLAVVERRMRRIMAAAHAGDVDAARAAANGMDEEAQRSAVALRALLPARPVTA
jgi:CheY-like chemotaxis protein/signal transduction histidine kinase